MTTRRPALHFSARKGWINDPNGFCFFGGRYHIFYQHNPYAPQWGQMHWGHAVSDDLVFWKELPIALVPDRWYEDDPKGGCFSGSAIVIDGILHLYYTAAAGGHQRQCVATSSDGVTFVKAERNPILEAPSGFEDFRDPKVFFIEERLFMVIGASDGTEHVVLLYEGSDPYTWEERGVLYSVPREIGTMPECPDFFPLDDKWVLVFSPIGKDTHGVVAVIGTFDVHTCSFTSESIQPLDHGSHYYAFQSTSGNDRKRYAFAWAGQWPWMGRFSGHGSDAEGWRGFLNFPRRLRYVDGRIHSYPVEGIRDLFTDSLIDKSLKPNCDLSLTSLGGVYLMSITYSSSFSLRFGSTQLAVDSVSHTATFTHHGTTGIAPLAGGLVEIFVDRMSTEIFFDGGYASICFNRHEDEDDTMMISNGNAPLKLSASGSPLHR
ncbi:MAG TPA: glycoside hydrolase family 32 protein [Sphaerochaeta sp.]|nr:MAG: glycoside hydrolase family 32 protein [Sphaerochaeta sp.]HOE89057.1 glycoside hydrolase family 32 protein [Sphaerochaeta sp.]HOR79411.1 glycoside hydrolase family 32 protein [Sphaerochaeta sp.]HPK63309.1 glycoside hydrolase family 32 protein [Sphaerochaeta sp.]